MENRSSSRLKNNNQSNFTKYFDIDKEPKKKRGRKRKYTNNYDYKDYNYEQSRKPGKLMTIINQKKYKVSFKIIIFKLIFI